MIFEVWIRSHYNSKYCPQPIEARLGHSYNDLSKKKKKKIYATPHPLFQSNFCLLSPLYHFVFYLLSLSPTCTDIAGQLDTSLSTGCHSIPLWDCQSHIKNALYLCKQGFLSPSLSLSHTSYHHYSISCLSWRRNQNKAFVIPLSLLEKEKDGFICIPSLSFPGIAGQRVRGDEAPNPPEATDRTELLSISPQDDANNGTLYKKTGLTTFEF